MSTPRTWSTVLGAAGVSCPYRRLTITPRPNAQLLTLTLSPDWPELPIFITLKATCNACPPYNPDTTPPDARFASTKIHAAPELHAPTHSSPCFCRRTHRAPPRASRPCIGGVGLSHPLLPTSFTQAGALSHLLGTERVTFPKCEERKRSCGCVAPRTTRQVHTRQGWMQPLQLVLGL